MDKEIIDKLLPAGMLGSADGMTDSFKKMSVNIDRVLRSDFVCGTNDSVNRQALDVPYIIKIGEETDVLRDDAATSDGAPLCASERWEEPYVTVPRVVGT